MKVNKSIIYIKATDDNIAHPESMSLEEAIHYNFMKDEVLRELSKSKRRPPKGSPLYLLLIAGIVLFLSAFL